MKKRLFVFIAVAIILCLMVLFFYPVNLPMHPQVVRFRNVARVGVALFRYKTSHNGELPSRLSELVSQYIEPTNCWFLLPKTKEFSVNDYQNLQRLSNEIDNHGMYLYFGSQGYSDNIILCERTNLWLANASEAAVLTSNCMPDWMSVTDVLSRLPRLSSANRKLVKGSPH